MSKYIDADLFVEMQIYDDEHEEWSIWNGTIEELLAQWTEEGCPPTIEVSEDCISRAYAIEVLSHVKKDEQWRTECIDNEIRLIKLLPSVVPIANKDEWIEEFSDDGWRWVKDES